MKLSYTFFNPVVLVTGAPGVYAFSKRPTGNLHVVVGYDAIVAF
jgi:hypothetical protein